MTAVDERLRMEIHPDELAHPWWCDGTKDECRPDFAGTEETWVTHRRILFGGDTRGHVLVALERLDRVDLRNAAVRAGDAQVICRNVREHLSPKCAAGVAAALSAAAGMAAVTQSDRQAVLPTFARAEYVRNRGQWL